MFGLHNLCTDNYNFKVTKAFQEDNFQVESMHKSSNTASSSLQTLKKVLIMTVEKHVHPENFKQTTPLKTILGVIWYRPFATNVVFHIYYALK